MSGAITRSCGQRMEVKVVGYREMGTNPLNDLCYTSAESVDLISYNDLCYASTQSAEMVYLIQCNNLCAVGWAQKLFQWVLQATAGEWSESHVVGWYL